MIEAEWWEYDSIDELADAVAGDVGFIIDSAVDARGTSLIAVPGGSTGPKIFPKLVAQKLPWKKVTIIPTDDRLVEMSDERSNIRLIAQSFIATGARVFPTASMIPDYRLAGNSADAKLAGVPVYTIAYGTENGYVDLDGKRNPVPVDKEQMQQVAQISGGQYFAAATPEQLRTVYENISSEVGYEKADREVTAQFAGFGLAFAVLAALGAISLGAKWP